MRGHEPLVMSQAVQVRFHEPVVTYVVPWLLVTYVVPWLLVTYVVPWLLVKLIV